MELSFMFCNKLVWKAICVAALLSTFSMAQAQVVRSIAVTGEAKKQVSPDAFNMSFTFEQRGEDLVSVKNDVDNDVQKATNVLIGKDVLETHIRSMDVTVYPWIENAQRERVQKGFVYRRTIYFTHKDIDAFDAIIKDVSALNPAQIGQLELINSNRDLLQRQLIKEALKDARTKAKEMASVMDMEVGHVMFMSDGTKAPEHMFENKGRMLMAQATQMDASLPGENTINARVEVVFELFTVNHNRP
jgi:uncharacterized protein YggE